MSMSDEAAAVTRQRRPAERIRAVVQTRAFLLVAVVALFIVLVALAIHQGVGASRLLSLAAWGVMLGGIIGLGSIGLTLVYGVLKFPNFSHGALVTFGAYFTYAFMAWLPESAPLRPLSFGWTFPVALVLSMPLVGLVALAVDRVVYRRLRRQNAHLVLFAMASLAMAFFLRSVIYIVWGPDFHFFFPGRANPALELPFNIRVRADQVFILLLALAIMAGLYVLLERTRIGKAMRATADNPELAQVRGINTERVIAWTWLLGGALAAAGGTMYGLSSQLRPEMGFWLLLPMFAAAIMGGIGNPYGALVGALVIGVTHQVSTAFLDPTYGPAVAFVLMVIVLLVRPQGLFGREGG
ncbi:High-affinity branched-chain amino acid transport system permease protein LivH [wastewater metagenome]|uniref:High-affinity branched-chain amino acid transport system permease protein LivH n=4 Tax=root TaxID=1 RepID=A0A5B8RGE6_9ZZZZ|nr:high-affinity branched-chain amino acid transport system permease protein LivH [uncultured organism]